MFQGKANYKRQNKKDITIFKIKKKIFTKNKTNKIG